MKLTFAIQTQDLKKQKYEQVTILPQVRPIYPRNSGDTLLIELLKKVLH